jgi:hypothetical protein
MTIMTFSKNTCAALFAVVILSVMACTKGDEKPESAFASGVFIACEGAFTGGTGTVSYYNRVDSTRGDIYGTANSGAKVGNVLQSFTEFLGVGYLLVNNANKMITVNPKTFVTTGTYDAEFVLPRYAVGVDASRLYVSSYGKDGVNGSVKLFDLVSKKVSRTVLTGKGTNKMIYVGGKIWAVNDGGVGKDPKDSTIVIINTINNADTAIEKRIEVGLAPNDILADNNGNTWVLCAGYFDRTGTGKLVQIRNEKVFATFDIPKYATSLTMDNSKTTLYFVANNKIYSKDPSGFNTAAPSVFLDNAAFKSLYGLGVDPKTGYLFIADGTDFTGNGQVFIYDLAAKTFKAVLKTGVGVAPNGFYFN